MHFCEAEKNIPRDATLMLIQVDRREWRPIKSPPSVCLTLPKSQCTLEHGDGLLIGLRPDMVSSLIPVS